MKKKKTPLAQLVKGWFAQPAAEMYLGPAVHLYSGGLTELQGCRAVLRLEETCLLVDLGGQKLMMYGDGLELAGLSRRSLLVRGLVLKTEFLTGEKEE